jgi:hypothetical protein
MVEAGPEGKQLGRLDLHIVQGSLALADAGLRGQLEWLIADQKQEILDLGERAKEAAPQLREYFEKRQKMIAQTIAGEEEQLAALPRDTQGSWLENKLIPLGTEIADDPEMATLLSEHKNKMAKLAPAAVSTVGAPQPPYVGYQVCARCHAPAVALWKKSKHAHAFATLVEKKRERDESCVPCHVTGTAPAPRMPDVQCEACHGPGAAHVQQPTLAGSIIRLVPEAKCRTCHNMQQSVEWEDASFRAAILGPGHAARALAPPANPLEFKRK